MLSRFTWCLVVLAGCQVTLPPGLVECGEQGECPEGYHCSDATTPPLCVEGAANDAGSRDGGGDARTRDGGGEADAGPRDAGGDGSEPVDGFVPLDVESQDAGNDAGAVEVRTLVFGGEGEETIDAMVVDDGQVFIAGTTDGSGFCDSATWSDCTVESRGIYVARVDIVEDEFQPAWARGFAGDVDVGGITVSDAVVVVGSFGETLSQFGVALPVSSAGMRDGFAIRISPGDGEATNVVTWGSVNDDTVEGVSAAEGIWCAVGYIGGSIADIDGINAAGGYLLCSDDLARGYLLTGESANDIDMSGDHSWVAWTIPGEARGMANAITPQAGATDDVRSVEEEVSTGELVAAREEYVALAVRITATQIRVFGELQAADPLSPSESTWSQSLSATGILTPLDMMVTGDTSRVVHLVGQFAGRGGGALSDFPDVSGNGFYVIIRGENRYDAWAAATTAAASRFTALGESDGRTVIAGDGSGSLSFPELALSAGTDAFLLLLPAE